MTHGRVAEGNAEDIMGREEEEEEERMDVDLMTAVHDEDDDATIRE